ncbi:hypothetical protein CYLTODRAFT_421548 [Cylindrobasidium torrendii FP15055 ss-10]|uniref:Uncharacterized protein n=1 Tax=Cylindrobasidium torrendii FP15055 ss-10 TaxID=1314674 RepID=A0A0D7BDB1_9AGAR|nr:hypothetical protein CYLTODRAFT_421548 [Cylindrobasidium torrendii FP15055 ss-10]
MAFIPAEEDLHQMLTFFEDNCLCPVSERKRFDEVAHLQTSVYTLGVDSYFQEDIFTRHPISGKVTRHRYPYTTLPKFTLPVHPCIAASKAGSIVRLTSDASPISRNLLSIVRYFSRNQFWSKIPRRPHSVKVRLTTSKSSSSSGSSQSSASSTPSLRSRCSTASSHSAGSSSSCCSCSPRPQKRKLPTDTAALPRPTKIQRRQPPSVGSLFYPVGRGCSSGTARLAREHGRCQDAHCVYTVCILDLADCPRIVKKLPQRHRFSAGSRQAD